MTLILVVAYAILFLAFFGMVCIVGDRVIRSKGYKGPITDHFDGTTFLNRKDQPAPQHFPGIGKILRWMLFRKKNIWETRAVKQTKPRARVPGIELVATLVNHATVLIQTNSVNIITDPIYSKRASPFSFVGPQRFTNPGVAFDDLPPIDLILISHNHYDHLDIATLKRLVARDNPHILAPLGNMSFLRKHGIKSTELDWWQSETLIHDLSVMCVPAQHFSARAFSDRNKTLWSGYAIHTPNGGDIYFAGDTGFGLFVDQIATRFPHGFRLGLLPIGAFRPEWFMKEVHISPEEAFAIQKRLKIQDVLAIHFGTFKLADDTQDEPSNRVRELSQSLPQSKRFLALTNGSSIEVM